MDQREAEVKMAQVGIVMGSDSDMPVMAKAAEILEELGVSFEMRRKASRLSLQEQVWQRIFRECARRFFPCR